MQVEVTFTLDVGETPYADAISFMIARYGSDVVHTAESPESHDIVDAVENVIVNAFDMLELVKAGDAIRGWMLTDVTSRRVK
jgi:hypothetical protein